MIKRGWPILILLGIILLGIGFWLGKRTRVTLIPNILQSPQLTIETKSEGINVKRVIDGDTIELENGEKVRYIGIDTPETLDPRKPIQCFGKEAAQKNRELVEGKPVWLTKDITDKDKYGRSLRYVYLGDPEQE